MDVDIEDVASRAALKRSVHLVVDRVASLEAIVIEAAEQEVGPAVPSQDVVAQAAGDLVVARPTE